MERKICFVLVSINTGSFLELFLITTTKSKVEQIKLQIFNEFQIILMNVFTNFFTKIFYVYTSVFITSSRRSSVNVISNVYQVRVAY